MDEGNGFRGYILPELVWDFFSRNEGRLRNEIVEIAENVNTGYKLCVTIDKRDRLVLVYRGDTLEKEEFVVSEADCTDVVCLLIDQYMVPVSDYADSVETEESDEAKQAIDDPDTPPDEETEEDLDDRIYEREDELHLAVQDFVQTAISREMDYWMELFTEEDLNDILDHFLSYLSDEYGVPIYRPTLTEDADTGEKHFTEYPYDAK